MNGRELVEDCTRLLKVEQKVDTGSNRALYPVILVFFGEKTQPFVSAVRDTLEDNWNNSKFLKYLSIVKDGDGFLCRDLDGKGEGSDPERFLEQAVVEMLATEDYVFEDKNRVKFEFILCGEDEDGETYYRLMLELNRSHSYSVLKTLYLMMDESDKEKKLATRRLLSYITEHRETTREELGTVYLLSNYLKNGTMLKGERLRLNYRLVANIILLGGNRGAGGRQEKIQAVYQNDCIKTAAYALVEKQIRNIAIVSLLGVMEALEDQGELVFGPDPTRNFAYTDDLKKRLGIQPGRINCLEEIFRNEIAVILPRADELEGLPYLSEKDAKDVHRDKNINWNVLNARTGGNWELFYQSAFEEPVAKKMADPVFQETCVKQIRAAWGEKLGYFDAIYGLKDGDVIRSVEELESVSPRRGSDSLEERMCFEAEDKVKKVFYEGMRSLLADYLRQVLREAERLSADYEKLLSEVRQEDMDDRMEKKTIERYYRNIAETFVKKNAEKELRQVFRLGYSQEAMAEAVRGLFSQLIRENEVYSLSFEEEREQRLANVSDEERELTDTNELEKEIEGNGRLHWNRFTYANHIRGTYYLVNKDAEYAKRLSGSVEYSLFHLNRKDCIEKIAIYDLDPMNGYCDLIEMAGEMQ
ncbi:hypothetical protein B5E84_02190 [Lachnoclostridium sp. An14]|uniref:hypothetical protein n=1 Tax=Lachnoclostridium sp. An14 TaxID=1965562 RepID=UPI000B37B226|nr:hypothetical protein [Lachnoclostridium sp. An14]OUQ21556.1 hypothetical protein B5E84_02190 [Lachnoclostridium sp. An14]